jgi:hypothetical protein
MLLKSGLSQLSTTAVVPQLKPMVDGFLSVNHNINDVGFVIWVGMTCMAGNLACEWKG